MIRDQNHFAMADQSTIQSCDPKKTGLGSTKANPHDTSKDNIPRDFIGKGK
jgi:hypothetical protein